MSIEKSRFRVVYRSTHPYDPSFDVILDEVVLAEDAEAARVAFLATRTSPFFEFLCAEPA